MKLAFKDLQKAVKYMEKNGEPVNVTVEYDNIRHCTTIIYYSEMVGQVSINIFPAELTKFPEITKTDRL